MAATKSINIYKNWTKIEFANYSEIFVYKNYMEDLQIYVGSSVPLENTKDYIIAESFESFSISELDQNTDNVYIRTNGLTFYIKILLV